MKSISAVSNPGLEIELKVEFHYVQTEHGSPVTPHFSGSLEGLPARDRRASSAEDSPHRQNQTGPEGAHILFGERHAYLKNQRAPIVKASTSPANSRLTPAENCSVK
jgi:hypothetical protein